MTRLIALALTLALAACGGAAPREPERLPPAEPTTHSPEDPEPLETSPEQPWAVSCAQVACDHGATLRDQREPFTARQTLECAWTCGRAHRVVVFHRDIDPEDLSPAGCWRPVAEMTRGAPCPVLE